MLPFKSKFGRCIECMVQIERSSTKQANKNNKNFTTIFLVCLMHILFFVFCLCLSGVEFVDSRTARTSVDNSLHAQCIPNSIYPWKLKSWVRACQEIYLWKRQSHEIISKTIIEGDILDKIKSVYTIRRNPMYNLHVIRMGDSRYTKAKSSNNLLVIDWKIMILWLPLKTQPLTKW